MPSSAPQLRLVGEAERVGADWELRGRRLASPAYGISDQPDEARALGHIPHREREPPAPREHADELRRRDLRARQMVQDERPHYRVEAGVRERQRLRIAAAKVQLRVIAPRHGQHSLGDIHAHGLRPARGRRGGDVPRAGRDIEHPHARRDAGGIQQGIHEARGDRAAHAAVRVSPPRPPAPLRAAVASTDTETAVRRAGIELVEPDAGLSLAIDGADEIDSTLGLLKGGGGALLREKLLVRAAERFLVVAQASKRVERLGDTRALPVEVVRFAWQTTQRRLLELVPSAEPRLDSGGRPVVTEEGNVLLDCTLPAEGDIAELAATIRAEVGVVEHGLFLGMADVVLLGHPDGRVEELLALSGARRKYRR